MWAEHERIARDAYRMARLDFSAPAAPLLLARRLFGADSVRTGPRTLDSAGMVVRIAGVETIVLRAGLPPIVGRFTLFHEIAHRLVGADEDDANRVAAALAVPFDALRAAPPVTVRRLAGLFLVSQTAMALRQAEAYDLPTIVRARSFAWVRGTWTVPPDGPGVTKTRLTDAERRYLLRPA